MIPSIAIDSIYFLGKRALYLKGRACFSLLILSVLASSIFGQPNLVKAEYFFDIEPGFGQGTPIAITPGTGIVDQNFSTSVTSLGAGVHQLFVRVQDANGAWSISNRVFFYKYAEATNSLPNLVKGEYFFDADPGFGQGRPVNIISGVQILDQAFLAGIDSLNPATHRLFIRLQDANGKWAVTNSISFNTNSFRVCAGGDGVLTSPLSGTTYRWQVKAPTDPDFTDIINDGHYGDFNTANLQLIGIPSSFYGYKYRCVVNNSNTSIEFVLKISVSWTGSAGTAWEDPANWNCGALPDANTDVIFNSGSIVVNSNVTCRSIEARPGTSLTINPLFTLILTGQ